MTEPCVSRFEDDIWYDELCHCEAILGWMVQGRNQASNSWKQPLAPVQPRAVKSA